MKTLIGILLLSISLSASAVWTITNYNGDYYLRNGAMKSASTTWIKTASEKDAKKLKKKLNKAEKKDNESFWNDGSDYCANPMNEC